MIRRLIPVFFLAIGSLWTNPAHAQSVQALIADAMEECRRGRVAQERAIRLTHFEEGQRLAEQAVALDEQEAEAHFAVFCNLGELMRIDGEMSLSSIMSFRHVMKELDRTLELAPQHLDALSSRGTLLIRLPFIFGGDRDQGEQLLQHVIKKEPRSINARLSLAKSYSSYGRSQEALTLAAEALTLAQTQGRNDLIPEATQFVTQLRATANKAN